MRNAIVVFSKVPQKSKTKTRLTTRKGGILTDEEAMAFYEGSVVDVINVCIAAQCGDVWICHDKDGDEAVLERLLAKVSQRSAIKGIFSDQGGSFDACMQYATEHMLLGTEALAESVMIVGGDIPSIQPYMLQAAYQKMEKLAASEAGLQAAQSAGFSCQDFGAALVEGACQEGGFSIVGFTAKTPFDFYKVFYNMSGVTALDMLVDKARERKIPLATVEMAPDVDIPIDLASMIPMLRALQLSAQYDDMVMVPRHTIRIVEEIGLQSMTTPTQR